MEILEAFLLQPWGVIIFSELERLSATVYKLIVQVLQQASDISPARQFRQEWQCCQSKCVSTMTGASFQFYLAHGFVRHWYCVCPYFLQKWYRRLSPLKMSLSDLSHFPDTFLSPTKCPQQVALTGVGQAHDQLEGIDSFINFWSLRLLIYSLGQHRLLRALHCLCSCQI